MRFALKALSVALMAAAVACGDTNDETFNPLVPDPTKARIRMFNATNTALTFAANSEPAVALNSNLGYAGSRCFNVDPANPGLSIVTTTAGTPLTLPTTPTLAAGKQYMLVAYNPTTTASNISTIMWDVDEPAFTAHADSAGLRVFNAAPTAGAGIDLYLNTPAVSPAPEPALTSSIRRVTNLPVGTLGAFFNATANASYQYRVTRTGVTSATLLNTTNTLVKGENSTLIIGLPASGTTTVRGTTTGGC